MNNLEKLLVNNAISASGRPARWRTWLKWVALSVLILLALIFLVLAFWMRSAIYNRVVRFPAQEKAWQSLRAQTRPVADDLGWAEFKGILHTHSHFSHDSEVPFEHILQVLKSTGLDFIALSDHCVDGRADFDLQWRGLHDGKLFIPGFEMRQGFMPFGVKPGIILSNSTDSSTLARQITENGGLLFFAHPEEKREWDLPELVGMEIYNPHIDFKRSKLGMSGLIPELIWNHRRYPDHVIYSITQKPVDLLAHWDDLNRTRHITGIGANDCHQNVGIRGFYTQAGTLRIEDTSPDVLKDVKLNWFTRALARICFGPLEPGRKLFHVQVDPYGRMARLVNTHILARELNEPAVLEALKAGRVFVSFDMIASSAGFRFFAANGTNRVVMGESAVFTEGTRLHGLSPLPCRFSILHEGKVVHQSEGHSLEWKPSETGKYRLEAELRVGKKWVPWVYANPIDLQKAGNPPGS